MIFDVFKIGIVFGFLGFLLETLYKAYKNGRIEYSGDKFFWNIPFLPIYAIGGLIMHLNIKHFMTRMWYQNIILTTILVSSWEYVSGVFCAKVIGRRFWDYRDRFLNIDGYVCLQSVLWWFVIVCIYYYLLRKYYSYIK